jgi:hypothetical protein
MLGFDGSLDLIMGITDYIQQLRYFRNCSFSGVYLCSCVCVFVFIHTQTDFSIHTNLYTHCVQFNALLQYYS